MDNRHEDYASTLGSGVNGTVRRLRTGDAKGVIHIY